jgi:hypothetical protein
MLTPTDGHNVDEDGSCFDTSDGGNTDITAAGPGLDALQDNGGPTETQALDPGLPSPAIDAGANCPSIDQRGLLRPQGSACDIGAFEYDPTPPVAPRIREPRVRKHRRGRFSFRDPDTSIDHFTCQLDAGPVVDPCTSPFRAQHRLRPGFHQLVVTAVDLSGRMTSKTRIFRVIR